MSALRASAAPRSLRALVALRAMLLDGLDRHPSWARREARIAEHLRAHFAARPPQLVRIDATSPRNLLAWIVEHEAVQAFHGLRDLERRLASDRRCYALVSPSMPDEPLAFTELALTHLISSDVTAILDTHSAVLDPSSCTCAMFYSISSCHDGLRGVPFGNELIRRTVDIVAAEFPSIRTFATVSPAPGFRSWLKEVAACQQPGLAAVLDALDQHEWLSRADVDASLRSELLPLCASYLLHAKRRLYPLDAVARFHLGNGARLERINWRGDPSRTGLARSGGITVNYVYDLASLDANRAAYHRGAVVASPQVTRLARTFEVPAA